MRDAVQQPPGGANGQVEGFKIECYGPDDSRVLRYFNGTIIRESNLNDYFTAKDKARGDEPTSLQDVLERDNNANWHIAASTICMASGIWAQKSSPVEWNEARTCQQNANMVFSKAKMLIDCLQSSRKLQLKHTVSQHEPNNQLVKYAIHSRNKRLEECSSKTQSLAQLICRSLRLQLDFLRMISLIKTEFKVLINARNAVDVSTIDVDYPASFSVFVIFYEVAFKTIDNSETNIWEIWDLHKRAAPTATQQCLISYYEDIEPDQQLRTRLTFPLGVSHFIKKEYSLTVNGAHVPVYKREDYIPLCYRLKKAQMCLIDRLIFTILCQRSLDHLRTQRPVTVGDTMVYVKSITSEKLVFVCKNIDVTVSYSSTEPQECGDVVWRLVVMKLRDIAVQNWKRQVFQHETDIPDVFMECLQYTTKLISKFFSP